MIFIRKFNKRLIVIFSVLLFIGSYSFSSFAMNQGDAMNQKDLKENSKIKETDETVVKLIYDFGDKKGIEKDICYRIVLKKLLLNVGLLELLQPNYGLKHEGFDYSFKDPALNGNAYIVFSYEKRKETNQKVLDLFKKGCFDVTKLEIDFNEVEKEKEESLKTIKEEVLKLKEQLEQNLNLLGKFNEEKKLLEVKDLEELKKKLDIIIDSIKPEELKSAILNFHKNDAKRIMKYMEETNVIDKESGEGNNDVTIEYFKEKIRNIENQKEPTEEQKTSFITNIIESITSLQNFEEAEKNIKNLKYEDVIKVKNELKFTKADLYTP